MSSSQAADFRIRIEYGLSPEDKCWEDNSESIQKYIRNPRNWVYKGGNKYIIEFNCFDLEGEYRRSFNPFKAHLCSVLDRVIEDMDVGIINDELTLWNKRRYAIYIQKSDRQPTKEL